MERRRHRQRQGAFGAGSFEHFAGFFDGGFAASNHGLRGVVEVNGFDNFKAILAHSPRHLCATSYHFCSIQPQNRRHGAGADGHGFLHGCGAQAHQRRGLRQRQHARGHQRRVFAQRMPGHGGGQRAALGKPDAPRRHASHQHHRLGVGGQRQRLFGAVLNQAGNVFAQRVRGFLQRLHYSGVIAPAVQHTNRLRTLARKDKSKRCHAKD